MAQRKHYTHIVGDYSFASFVSMTDAKRQATEHITAAYTNAPEATERDLAPVLLQRHGQTALVFRTVDGWTYSRQDGVRSEIRQDTAAISFPVNHTHQELTKDEAINRAASHICQLAWSASDGINAPDIITDPKDRACFETWATFQLRYKHFEMLGYKSETCWTMANDERVPLDHAAYTAAQDAILDAAGDDARALYKRGIITFSEVKDRAATQAHAVAV